jgi:hypothetical protein
VAALVIAPHPLIAGVGLAVAAWAAIVTLMVAIATVMHARDRSADRRRPDIDRLPPARD